MSSRGGRREGAGRPPLGLEKLKIIVRTSISARDNASLEAVAKKSGRKPSEVMREFIIKGLAATAKTSRKGREARKGGKKAQR